MNNNNLFLLTNPVFKTAKGSFMMYSKSGDTDAEKILKELNFSESSDPNLPKQAVEYIYKVMPGLIGNIESRFETTNKLIDALDKPNIVDLPCGYMPRGLKVARKNKNYIGCDLPVVISDISTAINNVIDDKYRKNVNYYGVDATNYKSLRKAFNGVEGELCITTEGMLMYFNDSELDALCTGIYKLLSEFGGCWVTFDRESKKHSDETVLALLGEYGKEDVNNINALVNSLSKGNTSNNILYNKDESKAIEFMNNHGLKVEKVPFSKYSASLRIASKLNIPKERMDNLEKIYDEISIWIMTADKDFKAENTTSQNNDVKLSYSFKNNKLTLTIEGRLDSISSPELLSLYNKIKSENNFDTLEIDMKHLEYISSAGIRTIKLISNEQAGNIEILNADEKTQNLFK